MADAVLFEQLLPGVGYEFQDVTSLFVEAASGGLFSSFLRVPGTYLVSDVDESDLMLIVCLQSWSPTACSLWTTSVCKSP